MADADVTPPAARAHCPHSEAFVIKTRVTRDQHLPDSGLKAWLVYRTSACPCVVNMRSETTTRASSPAGLFLTVSDDQEACQRALTRHWCIPIGRSHPR